MNRILKVMVGIILVLCVVNVTLYIVSPHTRIDYDKMHQEELEKEVEGSFSPDNIEIRQATDEEQMEYEVKLKNDPYFLAQVILETNSLDEIVLNIDHESQNYEELSALVEHPSVEELSNLLRNDEILYTESLKYLLG